jgi:hypothetical protein
MSVFAIAPITIPVAATFEEIGRRRAPTDDTGDEYSDHGRRAEWNGNDGRQNGPAFVMGRQRRRSEITSEPDLSDVGDRYRDHGDEHGGG